MKLILASGSPYRKNLLGRLGLPFNVVIPNIDEDSFKKNISDPIELAKTLAYEKAKKVMQEDAVVIGSDQVALFEGKVLGKPITKDKAIEQLSQMSGKSHQLITAVCLLTRDSQDVFAHTTQLTMKTLTKPQIESYVDLDEPLDCAGSYKIEKYGIALFSSIETSDFTSIEGLPLIEVSKRLEKLGMRSFL